MNTKTKEHILILGGGFGGVKAALELVDDERFTVTLLTEDPDLRYYPTLYHTATGGHRANSSIPLEQIFHNKEISVVIATAQLLDRKAKTIRTTAGETYSYDTLIIGLGVITNYFGIPGLAENTYSIKSQSEVVRFKKHLHDQMLSDRRPDLNYVIVGGGPTGIELSGALPEYLEHIMKNHGIKRRAIHIDLIEAAPRLLPRMPLDTSRAVKRRLKRIGVQLRLNSIVQGATADELTVSGKPIRSHTVVWTAGVTNNPFFNDNHFILMSRGKVAVDTYLQSEDSIYVIGDNANTPFSGLAQTALVDGKFVAENLRRRASGQQMKSYNAKQPATVIPAGPYWAAVCWGNLRIYGKAGWLLREAADFIGFSDLQPLPKATKQFLTEFQHQDNCEVCSIAQISAARA
jgi:NADH dehydrogenase